MMAQAEAPVVPQKILDSIEFKKPRTSQASQPERS
jgi:hypothetical protein